MRNFLPMCHVLVGCLFLSRSDAAPAKPENLPQPKVVRTWGELKSQPAIKLPDGSVIRLGVETDKVPRDGGFLVYGLVEGRNWKPGGIHPLGPVRVMTRSRRLREIGKIAHHLQRIPKRWQDAKQFLFVAHLMVGTDRNILEFRNNKDKLIARRLLTIPKEKVHPWFSFEKNAVEGNKGQRGQVRYAPTQQMVLPRWDGDWPFTVDVEVGKKKADDWKLPRFEFLKPDPRLKLTATGTTLKVHATQELMLNRLPDRWIARWWINGKPLRDQDVQTREAREEIQELIETGRELVMPLDLSPLKLKSGDRVSVQLLLCPDGWGQLYGAIKLIAKRKSSWVMPAMTNKVEIRIK